jgi:predicted acetyltransferase
MDIRPFDRKRDLKSVERIWQEVGWVDSPSEAAMVRHLLEAGTCIVGCLNDSAECAVATAPGSIYYLDQELSLCVVTAVTTSRIARKQGFARVMTAMQLAEAAGQGAQVAALGMFDQGFYDQLGFGTGAYEHTIRFDPSSLLVDARFRVPSRIHQDDWAQVHSAMVGRMKHHGACTLTPPEIFKAEMAWGEDCFGLGYYSGEQLTHFFWAESNGENGPYTINFMAYRTIDELLELLALIKSLGDQISSVTMDEPAHVQLQPLLSQPFRHRRNTRQSAFENVHRSSAWWQIRMLDVGACVAARQWQGTPFQFNLRLTDPAVEFLPTDGWQGVGGDYTISIGRDSSSCDGFTSGLPLLETSVNTFTRLFFGIINAHQLEASDGLVVPPELIDDLAAAFTLPRMCTSWDF